MGNIVREELNAKVIALLESGEPLPWECGWRKNGAGAMPFNCFSGHRYRGGNSLSLMVTAFANGWREMGFVTMKQASQMKFGSSSRLSEKQIERNDELIKSLRYHTAREHPDFTPTWQIHEDQYKKYAYVERWAEKEVYEEINGKKVKATRLIPIGPARVYNVAQIDGAVMPPQRELTWDPLEVGEKLLKDTGAKIIHGVDPQSSWFDPTDEYKAYYDPVRDYIHLPVRERFKDAGLYYAVALHETSHWSGHPSRLSRDLSTGFGTKAYAREELRAEIASMYLSADLGLPVYPSRAAAYVKHWISVIKEEPNALFQASADAAKIAEYVIGLSPEIKLRVEREREKLVPTVEHSMKIDVPALA
jgi:antirestriction protein ArdC